MRTRLERIFLIKLHMSSKFSSLSIFFILFSHAHTHISFGRVELEPEIIVRVLMARAIRDFFLFRRRLLLFLPTIRGVINDRPRPPLVYVIKSTR